MPGGARTRPRRQITAFAYPVGKGEDIGGQAVRAVREVGYRWAVTTIPGYNTSATEPHLLRRISTDPDVPISVLAARLWASGMFSRSLVFVVSFVCAVQPPDEIPFRALLIRMMILLMRTRRWVNEGATILKPLAATYSKDSHCDKEYQ